jgi:hypothetical protein
MVDKMDKEMKQTFDWLPAQMPGVAVLMKSRRAKDGNAHLNECWRRGVVDAQPGWFFAREGALAVGVPDPSWLKWPELEGVPGADTKAFLMMRDRESTDGAN